MHVCMYYRPGTNTKDRLRISAWVTDSVCHVAGCHFEGALTRTYTCGRSKAGSFAWGPLLKVRSTRKVRSKH